MRPTIGITPSSQCDDLAHGSFERLALARDYVDAVLAAGGIPLVLPPQADAAGPLLDLLDGLLLSGGPDVAPERYGEREVHPATYGIDPRRDQFELDLIAEALRRDTPLLAICRGIQVLTVALGGTLIQDIPDQLGTAIAHRQQECDLGPADIGHRVLPAPGSRLARLYAPAPIGVNSFHHQAIKDPAPDLAVIGRAEDGVIEAVELPGRACVLGVQWHPELMFARHPEHLAPFHALVEAALAHRLAGSGSR